MRILAVSDEEAKRFYDHYLPGCLDEFDLILACGDLKREYLEFLVTMSRAPVFYVHGNHDDGFATRPPEGCVCVDGKICVFQGVRILGLGGSHRYRPGVNMYSEEELARRVRRLRLSIWRHGGFDILMTHAPARGLNDFDTISHRGFECFGRLLKKYRPRYFVHGHIHKAYGHDIPQISAYGPTTVINACEYCAFDYEK